MFKQTLTNIEYLQILEYHIISTVILLRIVIPLFHVRNVCKMSKLNMFKMYIRTFWSQLKSCYDFKFFPLHCNRNQHTELCTYNIQIIFHA